MYVYDMCDRRLQKLAIKLCYITCTDTALCTTLNYQIIFMYSENDWSTNIFYLHLFICKYVEVKYLQYNLQLTQGCSDILDSTRDDTRQGD